MQQLILKKKGFSQYTIVPARFAYVLRTSIRPEFACLLERLLSHFFLLNPVFILTFFFP